MVPWAHPSLPPKRHLDRFSRFCTTHRRESHYFTVGRYVPPILSLYLGDQVPRLTMVPRAHRSHHPKRHLDRLSRFCMGLKCYAAQCIVGGEENPQNCPFSLGFRHPAGGGLSHGDRQQAQKIGKDRACVSGDMLADRQTHRQTCSLQYFATAPAGKVNAIHA